MRTVVYNESSHHLKYYPENLYQAKYKFEEFVKFIFDIKKSKVITNIQYFDILNVSLFEGYTVSDWLNDDKVDRSIKSIFSSLYDIYFIPVTCDEGLNEAYVINDKGDEIESKGCSWAICSMEKPCIISANTSHIWTHKILDVKYLRLSDECEIVDERYSVCNLSELSDVEMLEKIENDEIIEGISSAKDFWENRNRLFPNLIFCDSAYEKIKHTTKSHVCSVMNRLKNMNEYFAGEHSKYDPKELGMDARTESQSVKDDPELKQQRLFKMPSGNKEYFYDHIGFSGDYNGRIYFLPDVKNNRCYIGYIGKHLKTKKFDNA